MCITKAFRTFPAIISALLVAVPLASAVAGNIEISSSANRVVVKVQGAKLDDVLERLGDAYKFDVDRVSGKATTPVSGTFAGQVDEIVARLLVNDAHVIVRDSSRPGGIARILILKSRGQSNGIVTMAPGTEKLDDDPDRVDEPLRKNNPRAVQQPRFDRTAPMPPVRRVLPPGFPGAKTSRLEDTQ